MKNKISNKSKKMGTHIKFDDEEKYSMFVERKCDSHRVQKNKKRCDKDKARSIILDEWI